VARTDSGYRQYTEADVHAALHRRARELGFSMAEIAELVGLWHDQARASASVKRIAQAHIDDLAERIAAMQAMQRTLQTWCSAATATSGRTAPSWTTWRPQATTTSTLKRYQINSCQRKRLGVKMLQDHPLRTSSPSVVVSLFCSHGDIFDTHAEKPSQLTLKGQF
jgi:DNA-binding transcriptional MerR regulator